MSHRSGGARDTDNESLSDWTFVEDEEREGKLYYKFIDKISMAMVLQNILLQVMKARKKRKRRKR